MKCVNCGYEYFSKETQERGICPACGKSLPVKDETYLPTPVTKSKPIREAIVSSVGLIAGLVLSGIGIWLVGSAQVRVRIAESFGYAWDEDQLQAGIAFITAGMLLAVFAGNYLIVSTVIRQARLEEKR